MRKADIAEWILSLTTTRDRAAATAGDLMEEGSTRGNLWFWSSLLKTSAAHIWRAWLDAPLRMAVLAYGAILFEIAFLAGSAVVVLAGTQVLQSGTVGLMAGAVDASTAFALLGIQLHICEFLIGRWLARFAPGRELAACVAYSVASQICWLVIVRPFDGLVPPLLVFTQLIALLVGAVLGRRRPTLSSL